VSQTFFWFVRIASMAGDGWSKRWKKRWNRLR